MQFLRTTNGYTIPEYEIATIGPRQDANDDCGVAHHDVYIRSGNSPFVASATEVHRFLKVCEAPDAPKQRNVPAAA